MHFRRGKAPRHGRLYTRRMGEVLRGPRLYTNCERVSLYLNDKKLGEKQIEKYVIPDENDVSGVDASDCIDAQFKSILFEPKHPNYEDDHRLVWQYNFSGEKERSSVFETEITDAKDYEFVQFERLFGKFEVYLNGVLIGKNSAHLRQIVPYRFYCSFEKGSNHLKIRMSGVNTAQPGIYNLPNAETVFVSEFANQQGNEKVLLAATKHQEVIFVTFCHTAPYLGTDCLTRRTEALINALNTSGKVKGLVHFGNPYAVKPINHIQRILLGYSSPASQDYAIEVLAGKLEAKGKLPFDIKFN